MVMKMTMIIIAKKRAVDKMYINNIDTLVAANTARKDAGEKYAQTSWTSPIKKLKARNVYNKAYQNSLDAIDDVWGVAGPISGSNAASVYRGLKGQIKDSKDIVAAKEFKREYGGSGNDGTHKPLSQMSPKEMKAYKEELLARKAAREKAKEDAKVRADKEAALARKNRNIKIGVGVGGAVVGGGIGYGIYHHNKKKKEILEELKDPRFRRQHPELVKKYRKALIKQGIKVEAAGYYYDDYDNFDIIDTDYYEVY